MHLDKTNRLVPICFIYLQEVRRHMRKAVNPRPDGVFPDRTRRWGEGRPVRFFRPVILAPRPICLTTGPTHDPKAAFDGPWLELIEYAAQFYPKATDDVTSRVKRPIFYFLLSLVSPSNAAISD